MFRNKIIYLSLSLITCLLISCQPKDTFDWNAGFSAPKNYIAGGAYVEFFFQGKSIAGTSTSVGINPGWGTTSGGYVGGEKFKPVPDSVAVSWTCGFDLIKYKGGYKLPRQKMIKSFDSQRQLKLITVGMAPGGNVTLWLQGELISSEICSFKVKAIEREDKYDKNSITLWTSTGEEAKEILKYIYIHGIPYKIWETGEKEYDYDIGFSSKEISYGYHLTFNNKDGSWFSVDKFNSFIPWGEQEIKTNKFIQKTHKAPVQLNIQWYTNEENYKQRQWYDGKIVLPQNLEDFLRTGLYKRLLIRIEKDNHKNYIEGEITLIGEKQSKEIMKFRLGRYDYKLEKQLSPEYILPKGYIFPKWEGREPLTKPTDFEYWQEK